MSAYQTIDVNVEQSVAIVHIREPHLTSGIAAEMLNAELDLVLHEHHPSLLILDFRDVRMVSSSTIGVLLRIGDRMRQAGGQMRLCEVAIPINEVYRTLNLSGSRFLVFDTLQEAIEARVFPVDEDREVRED